MGACCGVRDEQDRTVTKELDQDKDVDLGTIKLLLLGAGGSGKSTLFKQLQYIHGGGFDPRQRARYQSQIYEQLISSMKLMITKCEDYYEDNAEEYRHFKLYNYEKYYNSNDNSADIEHDNDYDNDNNNDNDNENTEADAEDEKIQTAAENILSIRNSKALTETIIEDLRYLWQNRTIQSMYDMRNIICVPDSTALFFQDLDRITSADYVPTDSDLILVRYRTTGMQEKQFDIKGHPFCICDVGGQRNERRKWIHFFTDVTSVIFVVGLSCYDELTYESETNAMEESMDVFRETMNNHWFEKLDFILFLNKSDLYYTKILSVALTPACPVFSTYSGPPNDAEAGLAYIKDTFSGLNTCEERSFFQHITCATDRNQIEKVFNDVQTMIINWSLAKAGLT